MVCDNCREEFPDIEKLRKILLLIVRLFLEKHKNLNDLSQLDQERFKKAFRELISNSDTLLQRTRKSQIKKIEGLSTEEWVKKFFDDKKGCTWKKIKCQNSQMTS